MVGGIEGAGELPVGLEGRWLVPGRCSLTGDAPRELGTAAGCAKIGVMQGGIAHAESWLHALPPRISISPPAQTAILGRVLICCLLHSRVTNASPLHAAATVLEHVSAIANRLRHSTRLVQLLASKHQALRYLF